MQPNPAPDAPNPKRPWSPALLLLLFFPLVGLFTAALLIFNSAPVEPVALTPPPVTLAPPQPTRNPLADPAAIDFTLPTLDGGTISLSAYRGQPVLLNFWATWCVPCERELPAIAQFTRDNPDVPVLTINIGETAEQITPWLEERDLLNQFPVLLDQSLNVRDQFGVFSIPVTFGLDGEGVAREQQYGEVTLEDLQAFATALAG